MIEITPMFQDMLSYPYLLNQKIGHCLNKNLDAFEKLDN
jgi:hypothetical protein